MQFILEFEKWKIKFRSAILLRKIQFGLNSVHSFVSRVQAGVIAHGGGSRVWFDIYNDVACACVRGLSIGENDTLVSWSRQWGPVGNERAVVSIARKQEFRGAREYAGEQLYRLYKNVYNYSAYPTISITLSRPTIREIFRLERRSCGLEEEGEKLRFCLPVN